MEREGFPNEGEREVEARANSERNASEASSNVLNNKIGVGEGVAIVVDWIISLPTLLGEDNIDDDRLGLNCGSRSSS